MVATFNDRRRVAPNTTSTRRKTLGCYFPTIGVVLVPTLPIAKHLPFASLALDVPRPGGRARRHMVPAKPCSQGFIGRPRILPLEERPEEYAGLFDDP